MVKESNLTFLVKAGAKTNTIQEILEDGKVKVQVKSPAKEGRANHELISFLSSLLSVPKTSITIKSGQRSRQKVLSFSTLGKMEVLDILGRN